MVSLKLGGLGQHRLIQPEIPWHLVVRSPFQALMQAKCLKLSNNWDGSSELLVNHKSEDTHHSGTSVVQLNGTLLELGLLIERVPAEVNESVTEVTDEFTRLGTVGGVLHDEKLKKSNEKKDLSSSGSRDGVRASNGGETVGERVERVSGSIDGSREVVSRTGGDLSKESKLSNTSVLDLNVTETVETLLVGIIEHAERIVESKRRLGTKLVLEGIEGGGGLSGLGRGEGGGGGQGRGKDNRLHFLGVFG
jgi:hypothetical protein